MDLEPVRPELPLLASGPPAPANDARTGTAGFVQVSLARHFDTRPATSPAPGDGAEMRGLDMPNETTVETLKQRAATNGRSLQAELKAILEEQARMAHKAAARALATRIRQRIASRPQTDSGELQAEDRQR